jgi:hypothetical protein
MIFADLSGIAPPPFLQACEALTARITQTTAQTTAVISLIHVNVRG